MVQSLRTEGGERSASLGVELLVAGWGSPLGPLVSFAGGQIPLAKSNGAGNWSGRETILKVRSAGAGEQWLCDIPSRAQCAAHNWKAFVIWLPFDYDVHDGNAHSTGITVAEERVHIQLPSFKSQKCNILLLRLKMCFYRSLLYSRFFCFSILSLCFLRRPLFFFFPCLWRTLLSWGCITHK